MAYIKQININNEVYNIKDAEAARIADATITSTATTTVAVGGIAKGETLTNKTVAQVIEDIFFPYVPFTFSSIGTTASAGAKEYGEEVTISKVTPYFTAGSKPITSVKIGTTSGANDLYSGSTATSNSSISLSNSKTYSGNASGTIYCTISDGEKEETKSATVSRVYHTYYAVTNDVNAPSSTEWTHAGNTLRDISISANAGQYIWIASTKSFNTSSDGICEYNELGQSYNDPAGIARLDSQTLVNKHDWTCSNCYYFYRLLTPRKKSGTAKFKLGKNS